MTVPAPAPYAMLAELTHACPLHCVYCSNPLRLTSRADELSSTEWARVFREAVALGVVQVHLSGGEPLLRTDIADIIASAVSAGLYTHLVTSGVGLDGARAEILAASGLHSVQLSVQASMSQLSDRVAGRKSWDEKRDAAAGIARAGLPLTVNVVLHRHNLDELDRIIDLAVEWGATRLELANAQYYSWALENRHLLLPSRAQVDAGADVFRRRRAELDGRVEMVWVLPDYHQDRPKPCMGGWAQLSLTVAPDGSVLPCPVAASIATLSFDSVRDESLAHIWNDSSAFNAYRGEDWMGAPCRACPMRGTDHGGCRCQAFALTGDASRTDPVCTLSPDRGLVDVALAAAEAGDPVTLRPWRAAVYRRQAQLG